MRFNRNSKLIYRNLFGWKTNRKIVVIESDDWGSIRLSGREAYQKLLGNGIDVSKSAFTKFDGLESNIDLELLFELLAGFTDCHGRNPVISAACLLGNPDFEKIRLSNFLDYYYEDLRKTCEKYPNHDRVIDLWTEGMGEKIFVPSFHGREHLNVARWMRALFNNNIAIKSAFELESIGLSNSMYYKEIPKHLNAFDIEFESDRSVAEEAIISGIKLFVKTLGIYPEHFVPPNTPGYYGIHKILSERGIKYVNSGRFQKESLGSGRYRNSYHWLGKINRYNQVSLIRNCFFEPIINTHKRGDVVDLCMKEIESAFLFKKPAIISTHRVNYVSLMSTTSRDKGLILLKNLLKQMLIRWPEIEFLSSSELGETILNSKIKS